VALASWKNTTGLLKFVLVANRPSALRHVQHVAAGLHEGSIRRGQVGKWASGQVDKWTSLLWAAAQCVGPNVRRSSHRKTVKGQGNDKWTKCISYTSIVTLISEVSYEKKWQGNCSLLCCNVMKFWENPTFRRNILLHLQGQSVSQAINQQKPVFNGIFQSA
jgi:hypothetical protein